MGRKRPAGGSRGALLQRACRRRRKDAGSGFPAAPRWSNVPAQQEAASEQQQVPKIDKYLLAQLVTLFGFFSLVLVGVYWINRAVGLFDQLIANGHSALVFLEFSALTLPNVIRIVLPIASFAAAIYVANRMASDSEMVVIQSAGASPMRLARPVLWFGILLLLIASLLTHILLPMSRAQLRERQAEISGSITARLLQEGRFVHPSPGLTFYVERIAADGTFSNMFLSDSRDPDSQIVFSAQSALFLQGAQGLRLVMFDGLAQILDRKTGRLATTRFADFVHDLGQLVTARASGPLRPPEAATLRLLAADPELAKSSGWTAERLRQEGHRRIAQSLLPMVTALIGFAVILMGGFSRFSLWKQIVLGIVILVGIQALDNLANAFAASHAGSWPLVYLAPLAGIVLGLGLLWVSDRPALRARLGRIAALWRRREAPPAGRGTEGAG